ncbi:hypothetical protein N836_13600 [Leptolyngbya sp. Heron Island J]|uniref:hypothetical protein n=1 Tax=Leptolyngbya sp. Heron Island J TaxID=1385935 RepID=UPI0003B96BE4|nr:hypothetical protein [Leptolyngbya sp. Heron Island J]ESA35095.1 hypothetical protein N836_13600 [Leptolyngbya sp. Heron Island J]
MKFTVYSSMNDNGYYAVSKALCLQPENVLGLLMYSQAPSEDHTSKKSFSSLTKLTEEYGDELSKYQGIVLITAPANNAYDLQLTFFSIRGALDQLAVLTALIGNVPAVWINTQPKECTSVTDFHSLTDTDYIDWATSNLGIKHDIADLIETGYRRLISLNIEAQDREQKGNEAEEAVIKSLLESYRQKDS